MLSVKTRVSVPTGKRQRRSASKITPIRVAAYAGTREARHGQHRELISVRYGLPPGRAVTVVHKHGQGEYDRAGSVSRIKDSMPWRKKSAIHQAVSMCPSIQEQATQEPADE